AVLAQGARPTPRPRASTSRPRERAPLRNSQGVDHGRKAAPGTRDKNAAVRGILGKTELADAKCKQRWKRRLQVEPALVDFGQMDEKVRLDLACAVRERASGIEQLPIGQRFECVHECVVT